MPIDPSLLKGAASPSGGNQPITDWTEADLLRWFQGMSRSQRAGLPSSLKLQIVEVNDVLVVKNNLELSPQAIAYLHQVMGV